MFAGATLWGGVKVRNGMVTNVSSTSNCLVVDSPQQLRFCGQDTPSQARFEMLGSYPLTGEFPASGTFQTRRPVPPDGNIYTGEVDGSPGIQKFLRYGRPVAAGPATPKVGEYQAASTEWALAAVTWRMG